ncbi:PREDICTED: replication factor [Prunus dulcis]|uniref:PREDICTED: replication factor n=1 Tax=Prunus dulcis TaxID=3755 RepID=A0A5E4FVH9_PRUDU|nr:PREDICTED: replication factor [Prunus dulcis]
MAKPCEIQGSMHGLYQVRQKLYELLLNCIPPEIILKRLLYELLKKLDAELKHEEHRMRLGQKAIFHLEVSFHLEAGVLISSLINPVPANTPLKLLQRCPPMEYYYFLTFGYFDFLIWTERDGYWDTT